MLADYLAFARSHPRPLAFGFLLAMLSSFGQTFFVALSGAGMLAEFGITDGALGAAYAAATLASGFALGWVGRWIDRVPLRRYAAVSALVLALGCLGMALVPVSWALVGAFFLLRIGGQGLLTHTAMTATARRFGSERGRALALVALGFAAGEAILPPLAVWAAPVLGWRGLWWAAAGLVLLGGWAALRLLPAASGVPSGQAPQMPSRPAARAPSVYRDIRLWWVLPAVLAPSFVVTGFFFHQLRLAAELGWDLAVVAGAFAGFALVRAAATLRSGQVIDRIGAARLLPLFLLPLAAAMLAIMLGTGSPVAAVAYLLATGLTSGIATTLTTALWAEFYGPERLGAVRAAVAGAGIIASALAPAAFGLLLDAGVTLRWQAAGCLVWLLGASALMLPLAWRARREP
ncbi:MAG TPA: MFS transporter [Falsiroseomonas sp.]|jgi:MFS family permease|nr:MFS transporter [Falsiroseomonas sp.]